MKALESVIASHRRWRGNLICLESRQGGPDVRPGFARTGTPPKAKWQVGARSTKNRFSCVETPPTADSQRRGFDLRGVHNSRAGSLRSCHPRHAERSRSVTSLMQLMDPSTPLRVTRVVPHLERSGRWEDVETAGVSTYEMDNDRPDLQTTHHRRLRPAR